MSRTSEYGALEAILFTMGEPVETEALAAALGVSETDARLFLKEIKEEYEAEDHGIRLIELDDSWQFVTKPEYYEQLIAIASRPKKPVLTDVLMETLSIVSYRQPVTKGEVEKIRGVNSDHAVNRLVEYGLIREVGRMNAPGRPMLFGTTDEFLRRFGFSCLDDLPHLDPVQEEDFKEEAESEIALDI